MDAGFFGANPALGRLRFFGDPIGPGASFDNERTGADRVSGVRPRPSLSRRSMKLLLGFTPELGENAPVALQRPRGVDVAGLRLLPMLRPPHLVSGVDALALPRGVLRPRGVVVRGVRRAP
ncbi:MAG: hypothetical protein CL908_23125 [Deltaproteobacteria bacterium]|nr:hypothetical protein [Deltaproteobacteria bacterium]